MLHPARIATLLVVLALTLAVRALTDPADSGPPAPPASTATQHNIAVTTELTQRWRQLPEVREAQAGYDAASRTVTASAVCDACPLHQLVEKLAGDVWRSRLEDVGLVRLRVAHDDDRGRPITQEWDPVADAAMLYDRFGNGMVDPDGVDAG